MYACPVCFSCLIDTFILLLFIIIKYICIRLRTVKVQEETWRNPKHTHTHNKLLIIWPGVHKLLHATGYLWCVVAASFHTQMNIFGIIFVLCERRKPKLVISGGNLIKSDKWVRFLLNSASSPRLIPTSRVRSDGVSARDLMNKHGISFKYRETPRIFRSLACKRGGTEIQREESESDGAGSQGF